MTLLPNLTRIRTQLTGMERMIRTLRAEIETTISGFSPLDVQKIVEVNSGFSRLFDEGSPITPFDARPYKPFFPGVYCGIDEEVGGCGATVALKALHSHDPFQGRLRVARLSVNPVFPLVEKPRWVTVECDVDVNPLRTAKGLRIELISYFEIGSRNDSALSREVIFTLRTKAKNDVSSDHFGYHIPVSTMPFEHSIVVPDLEKEAVDLNTTKSATIILSLPTHGNYTFHMDHFSIQTIEE